MIDSGIYPPWHDYNALGAMAQKYVAANRRFST